MSDDKDPQARPDPAPARNDLIPLRDLPLTDSRPAQFQSYEEEPGVRLRETWRKVWRRKWMVLMIVLAATSFAAVEAFRQKSLYQATTTVEIGREDPAISKVNEFLVVSDETEIKTAIFLLKSRPLLEDVVERLKLDRDPKFLDITRHRSFWEIFSPPTAEKPKDVRKEEPPQQQEVAGEAAVSPEKRQHRSPEESARLAPFVGILHGNFTADWLRDTRLVKITITHTDPALAAQIANTVAKAFQDASFRKNTEKYTHTSDWLSNSTRKLRAQVEEAEKELADYSRNNNIFATEGKETLTTTKLAQLHDQLVRAETERMLKQSLYEQVVQGRVAQLPEAFSNATTVTLQQKLADLTIQVAQLGTKYGSKNPHVVELREQMAAIQTEIDNSRRVLEDKLKADYERAMRDEQSLTLALNQAKSEAVQQNQTAIQYGILKQRVETSKALYNDFLQKTSQADVQLAQRYSTVSIAEPAGVPDGPSGPQRFRSIFMALLLSLAASIGLVFLLDHLDNTIKSVDDVSRYARVPTLGVIPMITHPAQVLMPVKKDRAGLNGAHGPNGHAVGSELNGHPQIANSAVVERELLSGLDKHSPIVEAYRMLRTSILLSGAGRPPKTMLITSSQPAEGKTTTTVNTGIMLAQLGAKVLIIDADMRRPRIHKKFGVSASPGLSNYLSSDIELDALIRPTAIENLSLLCAGLIPPNSAELVSTEKMRRLLLLLSEHFDHILVDSPPVTNVTDPVILSRLVDGVILVIQGGKSKREVVAHARHELAAVGAKVFGVVLNSVNIRDGGYYNYYYGYRYHYADPNEETSKSAESADERSA